MHLKKRRNHKTRSRNKERKRSHQYKKNEKLRTATVFKNTHAAKQYNRTHVEVKKGSKTDKRFFLFCVPCLRGEKDGERKKR